MASTPSDLRVLVRRLASTPTDQLPRLCPVLVGHVLRCGEPLSASDAGKGKDKGAETPMLVHKLRTHITTLLTGRNASGRFAAVCLIKAVVDVGGWESLRAADPWVRGLISVAQVCIYCSMRITDLILTFSVENRPSSFQGAGRYHLDQDLHAAPGLPDFD